MNHTLNSAFFSSNNFFLLVVFKLGIHKKCMTMSEKQTLTPEQQEQLISTLQDRFE